MSKLNKLLKYCGNTLHLTKSFLNGMENIKIYKSLCFLQANILGITDGLDLTDRVDGLDRLVDTDFQN